MEYLHLSFSRVVEVGIFKDIKIDNSITISHLFYADDAVFIGEWSDDNLTRIMHVLHCFSLSSGVMVGGTMSTVKAWDDTICKLNSRLSKWKLKTLSIGGPALNELLYFFHTDADEAWKGPFDNQMDLELLEHHDDVYDGQAMVDNAVKRRVREFLLVIEKMRATIAEFDQNLVVLVLREKISSLTTDVKEHKGNLDRMMLESQKWTGYQVTVSTLESKVDSLEAEKARLEAVEASLHREVAAMKEPFDLSKAKGYRSSYKKKHTQASNDFATTTFPWLDEFVADAAAPIEALLSKKPLAL
ncbi:hypothetical protein Tco_0311572 [Tanacetum coccineum]